MQSSSGVTIMKLVNPSKSNQDIISTSKKQQLVDAFGEQIIEERKKTSKVLDMLAPSNKENIIENKDLLQQRQIDVAEQFMLFHQKLMQSDLTNPVVKINLKNEGDQLSVIHVDLKKTINKLNELILPVKEDIEALFQALMIKIHPDNCPSAEQMKNDLLDTLQQINERKEKINHDANNLDQIAGLVFDYDLFKSNPVVVSENQRRNCCVIL